MQGFEQLSARASSRLAAASPDVQRNPADAFIDEERENLQMKRAIVCIAALLAGCSGVLAQQPPQSGDLEALAMISDQVRAQGLACVRATSAQRDIALSRPDEAVWELTCDGARYRVRLTPDMAAKIELLSK
jgi:lysozyme family protein